MFSPRQHETHLLFAVRWAARLFSALSIGALLLLFFSGGLSISVSTWEEMGLLLLFPLGLITGLILGWQEEGKGGALAVFSVAAFYFGYGILLKRSFEEGTWVLLFLIPGLMLLLYSVLLSLNRSKVAAG